MNYQNIVVSQAIIWGAVTLGLLLAPVELAGLFGLGLTEDGVVVARLFGAELTALTIVCYATRKTPHNLAYTASNLLGTAIVLRAVIGGVMNAAGWLLVGLYAGYALLFAVGLVRGAASAHRHKS